MNKLLNYSYSLFTLATVWVAIGIAIVNNNDLRTLIMLMFLITFILITMSFLAIKDHKIQREVDQANLGAHIASGSMKNTVNEIENSNLKPKIRKSLIDLIELYQSKEFTFYVYNNIINAGSVSMDIIEKGNVIANYKLK